jgi:hypothetical protein
MPLMSKMFGDFLSCSVCSSVSRRHHGSLQHRDGHGRGISAAVRLPSASWRRHGAGRTALFSVAATAPSAAPHCAVEHFAFHIAVYQILIQVTENLMQKASTE